MGLLFTPLMIYPLRGKNSLQSVPQTQLVQDATSVGPQAMGQLFDPQGKVAPPTAAATSCRARLLRVSRFRVSLDFFVFIVSSFTRESVASALSRAGGSFSLTKPAS